MANSTRDYVYDYSYTDPPYMNDRTTEYSCHQITAVILLNAILNDSSMWDMTMKLRRKNMELSLSSSNNIITVSGYPPENDFDKHKVLKIVRKYNRGAQLIEE